MFLLVPAHPGSPGQNPESHKTVVVVLVVRTVKPAECDKDRKLKLRGIEKTRKYCIKDDVD